MTDAMTELDSRVAQRPASVGRMFLDRVAATPDREAFRYPVGDGAWATMTWRQAGDRVRALAAGLLALGVKQEERVAIAASTRVEWILADTAIMCAGAATTTIYPSTARDDVTFILTDSGSRVVFAEDAGQLAKLTANREKLANVIKVILIDDEPPAEDDWVMTFADLEQLGREHLDKNPDAVDEAVAAVGPEHLATLIYTSGTTGRPKGVRLVHDNWTYEGVAIDALGLLQQDDLQYLWLPLSHSFGKVLISGQLYIGFCSAVDGNLDRLIDNLAVVKPTFMAGAPRIFEKVHGRVVSMAKADGGLKWKIFQWAFGVGRQVSQLQRQGKQPSGLLALQHSLADRLVFSKLKERFGGRIKYLVSGAAPLSQDIAEWFHAAGLLILEGYGLTETSAASFVNRPDNFRFGVVGLPLPGTHVKIAEDGEILIKGPGVMRGYHNLPDETKEALTEDGWFHTGDIGVVEDGFLRVTDRKKDMIKTSGGKFVAPQKLEVLFKAICPYASQMVVHGDGRKFVSALITLESDAIMEWASRQGMTGKSYEEVAASPEVDKLIQSYVDELNSKLERWETIKRFKVLPRDLSVEEGDLTPSLKVKRKVVEIKHTEIFDEFYSD